MRTTLERCIAVGIISCAALWAGGLTLKVGNAEGNLEAKSINASLVAQVTACHEPAKSTVAASLIQVRKGEMQRTQLKLVPLQTPGMFAVIGELPPGSVVDLAVTNPEYKGYEPRVLVRIGADGVQKAGMRRFYGTPPTELDMKAMFGE